MIDKLDSKLRCFKAIAMCYVYHSLLIVQLAIYAHVCMYCYFTVICILIIIMDDLVITVRRKCFTGENFDESRLPRQNFPYQYFTFQ